MSQFSLVFIGRVEHHDEPVAQALSAAFGQGLDWGRPVVASAPIVLLEGLTEAQARAVHASLRNVETAGCKLEVYPAGSPETDGCSKLRWPTPPAIHGRPLESYSQPGSAPAVATAMAQISCPHCGGVFRVGLNVLSGTAPTSPRASNRQLSPSMGTPTPGGSLTSSGSYAPQGGGPGTSVPVGYGVQGVGTSSGFYQLPGSNAMIGPANPQGYAPGQGQSQGSGGPATPPQQQATATGGVSGSGNIQLPAAQPLPRARSVTPNPNQPSQPGLPPRPATPDRGQGRPSPQTGQRQVSPGMGQPTGRPQAPTPGTGMMPPRKPNSGHYGKPDAVAAPTPTLPANSTRSPIELPPARPLPSSGKPASNSAIPTLPHGGEPGPGSPASHAPKAPAPLNPAGGSEFSDLQGPMSLDEFEAHISGIHPPLEGPTTDPKKNPPPRPGRRPDRRR